MKLIFHILFNLYIINMIVTNEYRYLFNKILSLTNYYYNVIYKKIQRRIIFMKITRLKLVNFIGIKNGLGKDMELDTATFLWVDFGFTYKKRLIHSNETSATYNTSPYDLLGDSPLDRTFGLTETDTLLRHVVNRSRYRSLRDVESQNSSVQASMRHIFKDESMILLDGSLGYDNSQTKDYSLRNLQYPQGGGTSA